LEGGDVLGEFRDRAHQLEHVEQERHEGRHLQQPEVGPPGTDAEDEDHGQLDAGPCDGPHRRGDLRGPDTVGCGVARPVDDVPALPRLGAACLDGADRAQCAFERPAELAHRFLGCGLRRPDSGHQGRHHGADDHDGCEGPAEQGQVEHPHQHESADEADRCVDQADHAAGCLVQQACVGRGAGDQFAGGAALQVADAGLEVPADDRGAGVEDDPLREPAEQQPLPEGDRRADDDEGEQHGDGPNELDAVAE
jgi:hypothetical protein